MLGGVVCTVACVALLHLARRRDLPPVSHRLSEYATGPWGWVMALAFAGLAVSLFGMAVGLRDRSRPGVALALVGAAGAVLAAVFRTGGPGMEDGLHSNASTVVTVATVALAVVVARAGGDRVSRTLAMAAVVLLAVSPALHHTSVTGLSQRLLWAVLLAWLVRCEHAWVPGRVHRRVAGS